MNKTKRAILETALGCFMDKGVEQSTIADIRDASNISVGSIYHHFGNKEGIVASLFLTGMQDHASIQEHALGNAKNAEEGVKTIVRCYIDWIVNNPDWARFVFRYRGLVENSEYSESHTKQNREHLIRIKEWFRPHVEAGTVKNLPFEVYHALIIGPSQDFALKWLANKTRSNLADHRELYAEAAWKAIKTD